MNFTKRDLILSAQCRKAVWLEAYRPELAAELDAGSQLRYEQGNQVDQVARKYYGGGELIVDLDWDKAAQQTEALIEAGVTRLYQAAFGAKGLRIRADILDVSPGRSVVLREVKMSTRLKDEHLLDIASQVFVLQCSGYRVEEAYLVAVNNAHTPENGIPLFHEVEVTTEVLQLASQLEPDVAELSEMIDEETEPDISIGKHCTKPWTCAFYDYCWQDVPKASVFSIPRLSAKKLDALRTQGILHLTDVPHSFSLTDKQRDYIAFQTSGAQTIHKAAIKEELDFFVYPIYFLDFETHSAPIPPYPRTYPYQQVPFQFSVHELHEDRTLLHHDYLHVTDSDPRQAVAEHLLQCIGDSGSILTYNARFEIKVLEELASALPQYADALQRVIGRVYDQLPLIRKNVQDPELHRSYSLKTVTRVLLNDDSYANLPIANGEAAHFAWVQMQELTDLAERNRVAENLKAYCCQDTLAQVHLHYWCERVIG